MIIRTPKGSLIAAGRLSKDPETRTTTTGKTVTSFGMNVSDDRDNAEWLNVSCWGSIAEYAQTLSKGDTVMLCGHEKQRTYKGRDGEDKTTTDTTAIFLCKQPGASHGYSQPRQEYQPMPATETDEDLPF